MIKNLIRYTAVAGAVISCSSALAGNEDRVGSAGATELLINPWATSTASGGTGIAYQTGLEASFTNIAGIAFTEKTQIKFDHSNWLGNAGIGLNTAGFAQRVSESGVIAVSVQSYGFGNIDITTVSNPDGGVGTFSPKTNIFNVGYARSFSASIYGGVNFKVINESISNLKATGVAFDAGIRYVTGERDQLKLGISLKNVGPTMKFKGDGISKEVQYITYGNLATLEQRTEAYELPSLLSIGVSYDFIFDEKNKLTAAGAFTANSFQNDQYSVGADYAFVGNKVGFNLRAGYVMEKNMYSVENRSNTITGFTAGFSVNAFAGKNKNAIGVQYAMRLAGTFGIVHTFGVSIALK